MRGRAPQVSITLVERLRAEAADMRDVECGPWPPLVKQAFRDVSELITEAAAEIERLEGDVCAARAAVEDLRVPSVGFGDDR